MVEENRGGVFCRERFTVMQLYIIDKKINHKFRNHDKIT